MAWTTPLTAVANATLTAAQWNASVRDNLNETAAAKASTAGSLFVATGSNVLAERTPTADQVLTGETTGSTSYGDLTTPGPAVTVTTGTQAIVTVTARVNSSTATRVGHMDFEVSGASSRSATDDTAMRYEVAASDAEGRQSAVTYESGLTAGSNTFTAKYRHNVGAVIFSHRSLLVMPL